MTSQSLQNFIDTYLVDEKKKIYTIENFTITNDGALLDGTNGADNLSGTKLSDIIWGNGGNDILSGGAARDLLTGAAGHDTLYGGDGDDRLQGWGDNDRLFGDNGEDALYGGEGNDKLYGGAKDDYLCGGSSRDELSGGAGKDVFVFRPELNAPKSESLYMDFVPGQDILRIEDYLLPNGLKKSMIKVDSDGDLYINTQGGHRLSFETLHSSDINALYNSIDLI